jgi:hypothetical protein
MLLHLPKERLYLIKQASEIMGDGDLGVPEELEDPEDIADELDQEIRESVEQEDGRPREILHDFSRRLRRPVSTLYVLDGYADPFYIGDERRTGAEWFARIWHDLGIPPGYHLRRIHYRLISQDPPLAFWKGGLYLNTAYHWDGLGNASRDAVALGLIPLDAFVDRRNPSPITYLAQPFDSHIGEIQSGEPFLAPAGFPMPSLPSYGEFTPGVVPQPYHVEIWAEKSTMNDILQPLARTIKST